MSAVLVINSTYAGFRIIPIFDVWLARATHNNVEREIIIDKQQKPWSNCMDV